MKPNVIVASVAMACSGSAWAHGDVEAVVQHAVAQHPSLGSSSDVTQGSRGTWFASTPSFVEFSGTSFRLAGPDVALREQALIGVRTASVSLGSFRWRQEQPVGGVRFIESVDGRLAMFHSSRGAAPFVEDRSNPLELCGSQSALATFVGLGIGARFTLGASAEVQDDPFHFRFLSGIHAGTGCLGHPPVWTSGESVGLVARWAFVPDAALVASLRREAQRVTYAVDDDVYGLLEGRATSVGLAFEVRG